MARRMYKPRARSFWNLVRRLLLQRNNPKPPPAHPAAEEGEKSGLLSSSSRSSLEELLRTDVAPEDAAAGYRCANKKHGLATVGAQISAEMHRPVTARSEAAGGGRDRAAAVHRRFMFGGFRRRLLTRRPWRPMLVAIPE